MILAPLHQRAKTFHHAANAATPTITYRAQFAARLTSLPGLHLVIVRPLWPDIHRSRGVDFNGADLDHAKIVWAPDIPGLDIGPLLHHFSGRGIWIAEPDVAIPVSAPIR